MRGLSHGLSSLLLAFGTFGLLSCTASYVPTLPIHGYAQGFRVPWGVVGFLGPGMATTKSGEYQLPEDSGRIRKYRDLDKGDRYMASLDVHLQYGWSRVAIGSGTSLQQVWYSYLSVIPVDGHMLSVHWGYPYLALKTGSPAYGMEYLRKVRSFSLGGGLARMAYPTAVSHYSEDYNPTIAIDPDDLRHEIDHTYIPYLRAAMLTPEFFGTNHNGSLEIKYGYMPGWEHPHYLMFGFSMPM